MSLAYDAVLDVGLPIADRMSRMLLAAIDEAVPQDSIGATPFPCLIGLPEPRTGLPASLAQSVGSAVTGTFSFAQSQGQLFSQGHASALIALQTAAHKIASGEVEVCLVAGVDSYLDVETLEWMDEAGTLLSSSNRNGFAPGEGAGACLLASRRYVDRQGLPILARIAAAATGFESETLHGDGVCIGAGLSATLKSITQRLHLPEQAISKTYCDLNGQRYRSEEMVYTLLRVQEAFVDAHDFECPADCWGDMGAASGPLFLSLAISAAVRGYASGDYPVAWAGSEGGHRSATLLRLGADV
jgi:3-oxoacyl-[acyl-carrier-protein] synthase-1